MSTIAAIFSALGQETRLSIADCLARAGQEGLAAGELSARLDVAPSLMTAHLTVLRDAGIVSMQKRGKFSIYTLVRPTLREAAAAIVGLVQPS